MKVPVQLWIKGTFTAGCVGVAGGFWRGRRHIVSSVRGP